MEDQNTQQSSLCRTGCGFYGSPSCDGMCSQCYKDSVRRTQSTSPNNGRISPVLPATTSVEETTPAVMAEVSVVEREQPISDDLPTTSGSLASDNDDNSPTKIKRKNRCTSCRKKVGLTGFECRCGGLFCSLHRYSDKHGCSFDYKTEGQAEIRKNNPIVVRDKVAKF